MSSNRESVELYKDYTYIMYILCYQTSSFYAKIKNIINIPIVICSTCLSIINTPEFNNDIDKMMIVKNISTCFNLLIALSIAVLNLYKITEKEFSFKSHAINFLKLHNKINAEIAKSNTLMLDIDIMNVIDEYNLLCEYITFHIPSHIRKKTIKNYPSFKMPTMIITNKRKSQEINKTTQAQTIVLQESLPSTEDIFIEVSPNSSSATENSHISVEFRNIISYENSPFAAIQAYNIPYSPIRVNYKKKKLRVKKSTPPQ